MKKMIFVILFVTSVCSPAKSIQTNLLNRCKANIESLLITIEYSGNSKKKYYSIFAHHENLRFKLENDPYRLEYKLNTTQINALIDAMFNNRNVQYITIENFLSTNNNRLILDDMLISVSLKGSIYNLQLSKSLNRKTTFRQILKLPQKKGQPNLSYFMDAIDF
ncbi:MAG: hypothetical protein ABUK01_18295 [Leptospirales bacterium]